LGRWWSGGPAYYAYSTNYLVDTDAGIIVDVEATPTHRTLEVQSTRTMIERVEARFTLKTKKLIGDTAYGTAEFLDWMVNDKAIEPHVPVWDNPLWLRFDPNDPEELAFALNKAVKKSGLTLNPIAEHL
jgi:hypothetical protein